MIGNILEEQIRHLSHTLYETSPFYIKASKGTLTQDEVGIHLANLLFLLQHTPIHLKMARQYALDAGNSELAAFMEEKIVEECGHDQWAMSDLKTLGKTETSFGIVPSMRNLVSYIEKTIHTDPMHYVAYMLCAEYVTVLLGPRWVSDITEKCGITPTGVTVISKHVEADKKHFADDLAVINKLIQNSEPKIFTDIVQNVFQFFFKITSEEVAYCENRARVNRTEQTVSA